MAGQAPTYDVTFTNVKKYPFKKVTVAHRCKFESVETKIPGNDEVHLFITGNYLDYVRRAFNLNLKHRGVLHIRTTQFPPEEFNKTVELLRGGGESMARHVLPPLRTPSFFLYLQNSGFGMSAPIHNSVEKKHSLSAESPTAKSKRSEPPSPETAFKLEAAIQ